MSKNPAIEKYGHPTLPGVARDLPAFKWDGIADIAEASLQLVGQWMAEEFSGRISCAWSDMESPIEVMFFCGAMLETKAQVLDFAVRESAGWTNGDELSPMGERLIVHPQFAVGEHRADFCLVLENSHDVKEGEKIRIVTERSQILVECDGHDFHEKTKKQAAHDKARDRALVAAGHKVLRFTGSEIYADPCACAAEAIGVLYRELPGYIDG